jgi:hypothetical protein
MSKNENTERQSPSRNRVVFEFGTDAMNRLESLRERRGGTEKVSKADIIRDALRLYEWLLDTVEPDQVIKVESNTGELIYRLPAKSLFTQTLGR